ncbi:MFS transporter [Mycolicibacter minnesotensis]
MPELNAASPQVRYNDSGTGLTLSALMCGTLVGTLSNNIVNVPLPQILAEFDAPLSRGVFVVVGFLLTFAATMPVTGWAGDRFGRRRAYCVALVGTAVCAIGSATAPSLEWLIAWRSLGGVFAGAFAPGVMGLISWLFGAQRRSRAIGVWASVNGGGQALGPSMGGLIADSWGWRWVFVPLIPVALLGLVGALRHVPAFPGTRIPIDLPGAVTLTAGTALLVLAVGLAPSPAVPWWTALGAVVAALLILTWFVRHCLRVPDPFVPVRLAAEPRFVRSSIASFAQMFSLAATLLVVPLFMADGGFAPTIVGLVLLAVPVAMVTLGPTVGRRQDRLGPRRVLRAGLIILIGAQAALAATALTPARPAVLIPLLLATGLGVALVQTPTATGSTRSPAGAQGTGLGLFNLIRFTGSALGAAWVSLALTVGEYPLVFAASAAVCLIGVAGSFLGRDPTGAIPANP